MSESAFLQVRDLCVSYGLSQVLFDVTLAASRHGAVAVLGRNGAGKSTLLKTIVGELAPRSGSIALNLQDITRLPTERRIHTGMGYVPQEHSVFNRLSVRENLAVGALTNRDRSAIDHVLARFPKLGQRLGQSAGTLSGGERKMLAIGRAILSSPKLLLLDEPTEGVWIGVVEEIAECLRDLIKDIAVVIVEQHLELALGIADYAYVLDRGRVALEGRSAAVRKDPMLLQLLAPQAIASRAASGLLIQEFHYLPTRARPPESESAQVWAFSYLFKSVIDFVFQNPHPRAVAGDVWKG